MAPYISVVFIAAVLFSCSSSSEKKIPVETTDTVKTYSPCNAAINDQAWYQSGQKAPLFDGLNGLHFPVSTKSAEAQKYFDQGLLLAYSFNHAEAARSFWEAARIDSTCAMCWWGFAYVLGPNYNGGMEEGNFERAYAAVQKAVRYVSKENAKESALVNAMSKRYSAEISGDRSPLDKAYSEAMKSVYDQYPKDADIAAMYAESMMDLHPWNLYMHNGTPQPWTPEIERVLESALSVSPDHPALNHFYIHAVEASRTANRAMRSAKLLETLIPVAGHMVHMPSHIYIRTGNYHDGVVSNERALVADSNYVEKCHASGAYPLAYYPHNSHFVAACAALGGESKKAMEGSWKTSLLTSQKLMQEPEWSTLQHYYLIPWYTAVKFSQWNTILKMEMPFDTLKYPSAIEHYARGMAHCGLHNTTEAMKDLTALNEIRKDSSVYEMTIWGINSIGTLLDIADKVLAGNIALENKDYPKAQKLFTEAVAIEDRLNYNEPPDWFFSVRHYLGATLLKAGKYGAAEKVFLEDLVTLPENGFALNGLYESLLGQKKLDKAAEVKKRFDKAWEWADCELQGALVVNQ